MKIRVFPVDETAKKQALYLEGGTLVELKKLLESGADHATVKKLLEGETDCVVIQEIWKAALGNRQENTSCRVFPRDHNEIQALLELHFQVEDLHVSAVPVVLIGNSAFSVDATAKQIVEKLREEGIEVELA